ncbi:DUF6615 family protein [Cellulomonas sp. Leaf395]|uniref:DUF6615 family protein n=1 Tax=Cellulomonas sp. Leaf395 TaxID=1736362 RepID=UPI000AB7D216|nr:DUF6615 family protein [Cellulomonas sp. Leaf395]
MSAIGTGDRISAGESVGVRQSEETITELVLLELAQTVPGLRIRTLKHSEETAEGADWEWWIEGTGGWFHFLVQAKRIHWKSDGTGTYDLGYRPRARRGDPPRLRQIDTLLDTARTTGTPAIYALYNQADSAGPYSQTSCFCAPALPAGIDGVTAIAASTARRLLDAPGVSNAPINLQAVRPYAAPWSCLATCFGRGGGMGIGWWPHAPWNDGPAEPGGPDGDAAAAAASFVASLSLRTEPRADFRADSLDDISLVSDGFRREPPPYVPLVSGDELHPSNQLPHPLARQGRAPRFVVAQYRSVDQ